MIRRLFHYLFKRNPRNEIPLLPRRWSSDYSRYGDIPANRRDDIDVLKAYRIARTDQDAWRLLNLYNLPAAKVVQIEARKRRRADRLGLAWNRLKRLL